MSFVRLEKPKRMVICGSCFWIGSRPTQSRNRRAHCPKCGGEVQMYRDFKSAGPPKRGDPSS